MDIKYIEKEVWYSPEGSEPATVGLKWTVDGKLYGAWKIRENESDDFHFLVSAAYWWSMYQRNWLVRLWTDIHMWWISR